MLVVHEMQPPQSLPVLSLLGGLRPAVASIPPVGKRDETSGHASKSPTLEFQGMHHPGPYRFRRSMVVHSLSAAPGPTMGSMRRHERQQIPLEPPNCPSYSAKSKGEHVRVGTTRWLSQG
jgi:hypothetical protein